MIRPAGGGVSHSGNHKRLVILVLLSASDCNIAAVPPVAEFIDPDWGQKVNSGIGMSFRPARLHGLTRAGTTTLCRSWLYPPVMDPWIRPQGKLCRRSCREQGGDVWYRRNDQMELPNFIWNGRYSCLLCSRFPNQTRRLSADPKSFELSV